MPSHEEASNLNLSNNDSHGSGKARATSSFGRVALACALALVAVVAGLYWAAADGYLKQPLARWCSAQLGRSVAIDGDLRVELGRVTRLSASGVRLANVSWGGRPQMLMARYLLVDLDTRSLLQNTVVIRKLVISGLDLRLERNGSGQNNWTFNLHRHNPSAELPVIIESLALPGARVRFSGPRLERALDVAIETLVQNQQANGMLDLAMSGLANDTILELRMSAGPAANLIQGKNFRIEAQGRLGDIALGVDGHVDSLEAPANSKAIVSMAAPDAAYLADHLGLRRLGGGPVALKLTIAPTSAGTGIQGSALGQIGEFTVDAQGSYVRRPGNPDLAVQARIAGPDLSRIGRIAGVRGLPSEPFQLQADVRRTEDAVRIQKADLSLADGRVMVSGFLGPRGELNGSELAFSVSIPELAKFERRLGMMNRLAGSLDATGTVHHTGPGETKVAINVTSVLGKFTAVGPIGRAPDYYGTRLTIGAVGTEFAPLARALKLPDPPTGPYKGSAAVEWSKSGLALRGASLTVADETLQADGSLGRPPFALGADMRLDLSGSNAARLAGRFGISGFPSAGYRVAGRIHRELGRLELSQVKASTGGAEIQLDGTLGDGPKYSDTNLDFVVSAAALEAFGGLYPQAAFPHGRFRAAGRVSVVGEALQLRNAQLVVAGAQGTVSATAQLPLSSQAMQFEVQGKVPDLAALLPGSTGAAALPKDLEISATGSRLKDRWSVQRLRIASGSDFVNAVGELVFAPGLTARNLQLTVRAASLRRSGLPSGHKWPDQPIEATARLSSGDNELTLDDLTGRLGGSDFTGRIEVHGLGEAPDYDVSLESKLLDLAAYADTPEAPSAPVPASPPSPRKVKRQVIPADEVRLPNFNGFSGKIELHAQTLHLRELDFRDLQVLATIRDGHLHVDPLKMTGAAGQVSAHFDLLAKGKRVTAQVSGTAKNLHLSPVLVRASGPNDTVYTARVALQGSGSNLREIAATLTGRIRLVGTGGRLANSRLMAGSNDFAKQLLSSLNPLATRQPTTEVECVAYLLSAKDGVLTTDPALVMRTSGLDIISNGSADLRTENIDLSFKIAGRKGIGIGVAQIINPYLKVTGTLGKPAVTLDPTGALVNGGAAFATAGLSVVATTVWDRIFHEKDPCAAAVAHSDRRKWD